MVAMIFLRVYCALILTVSVSTVSGLVAVGPHKHVSPTILRMSSENKAPKHDVGGRGGNPLAQLPADQRERVEKFMEHQNSVPKIGFPVDVRSLVQYNHGFAVISTNSKS